MSADDAHLLSGAVRRAVHDRRRRRARAPQRDRRVHVRRAHAQRGQPDLVTFSRINGDLEGQIMAFFVMVVAAAEVVVGLAIIMAIFRTRRSASVDDANLLKY